MADKNMPCDKTWERTMPRSSRVKSQTTDPDESDYVSDDEDCDSGLDGTAEDDFGNTAAQSRCSVRNLCSVIGKFDEHKKDLVVSTGFGGLLHINNLNRVSRQFSVWLFDRMKVQQRTLMVGRNLEVAISPKNVQLVLGIPATGNDVCPMEDSSKSERDEFVRSFMGAPGFESNPLKGAEEVIMRKHPNGMTKQDDERFSISFVVWAVGVFLAPTNKYKSGCWDFWGALLKYEEIKGYNWGRYVVDHLLDSARKVQYDLHHQKKVATVSGCSLFLQVLYLDNAAMGSLTMPHIRLPRIRDFDCSRLNKMIDADTVGGKPKPRCKPIYGISQGLSREKSAYECQTIFYTSQGSNNWQESHSPYGGTRPFIYPNGTSAYVDRPDFGQYIRQNYPDMANTPVGDEMKLLNAKILQHCHRFKNALVYETMAFAGKVIEQLRKGKPILPQRRASPRTSVKRNRANDDYLSGPESGSDGGGSYPSHKRRFRGPDDLLTGPDFGNDGGGSCPNPSGRFRSPPAVHGFVRGINRNKYYCKVGFCTCNPFWTYSITFCVGFGNTRTCTACLRGQLGSFGKEPNINICLYGLYSSCGLVYSSQTRKIDRWIQTIQILRIYGGAEPNAGTSQSQT